MSDGSGNGSGGAFGNLVITNGNGEPLGTIATAPPTTAPTDTIAPVLTAGTVTRNSNLTATVQFTSTEAGRYYYSAVVEGVNAPLISTIGAGTVCIAGQNTITVYLTSGAKDLYIKVKDAAGNVSDALKIYVPAYSEAAPASAPTPTPTPNSGNGIIYQNPDYPGIIIKIGGK
jgi:hypothetical protein